MAAPADALAAILADSGATLPALRRGQGALGGTEVALRAAGRIVLQGDAVDGDLLSQDFRRPFQEDPDARLLALDAWLGRIEAFALMAVQGPAAVVWTSRITDGPADVLLPKAVSSTDDPTPSSAPEGVSLLVAGPSAHQRLAHPGPVPMLDGRPLEDLLSRPVGALLPQALLVQRGPALALVEGRHPFPLFWRT